MKTTMHAMIEYRVLALLALLAVVPAAGCNVSGTYAPMTIEVRDAMTKAPVADALVEARALHFFLPEEQGVYFRPNPDKPRSVRGQTNATGQVRLNVVVAAAVQIVVTAPGYDVFAIDLDRHPADGDRREPTDWLDTDVLDGVVIPQRLQVRFAP